jgi:hypothetical protein
MSAANIVPRAAFAKVEVGERLALFTYYVVTKTDKDNIYVTDQQGQQLRISAKIVDDSMVSTSQFTEVKKVTKTQLAVIMEGLGHSCFRVTFHKQVVANSVADGLNGEDISTSAKRRKIVQTLMKGEARVMHARLWRGKEDDVEMELGRYKVVDLEASVPGKPAQRLVDTRTITELIVEGIRYYV